MAQSAIDVDGSDATFYSAADSLNKQKSKRQGTYEARKEAEVVSRDGDSNVSVQKTKKTDSGFKIVGRNGRPVVRTSKPQVSGEMSSSSMPNEHAHRSAHLRQIVRDRAAVMASKTRHNKK